MRLRRWVRIAAIVTAVAWVIGSSWVMVTMQRQLAGLDLRRVVSQQSSVAEQMQSLETRISDVREGLITTTEAEVLAQQIIARIESAEALNTAQWQEMLDRLEAIEEKCC